MEFDEELETNVVVFAKPWYKSHTIWFNAISLLVLILGNIVNGADILELNQQVVFWINLVIGTLIAFGNLYLRAETTAPVTLKDNQVRNVPGPARPH